MEARKKIDAIHNAREVLREAGYFVDNLWSISDIKDKFVCENETAHDVLYDALTNDATMEQIWLAIDITAREKYDLNESII